MKHSSISRRAKTAERVPRSRHRGRPYPPALEWAEDITGRCPRITAFGGHSLLVENHTGIRSFSDSRVLLDSRAGTLCVEGRGLALDCVRDGALILRGEIRRVELPCEGGDPPDER